MVVELDVGDVEVGSPLSVFGPTVSAMTLVIALAVLVGTAVQAVTSAQEVGAARRAAVDWWDTEDALVDEQPRRRRRATRRELRSWRDPQTHRDIRHVQKVLYSWVILTAAAAMTVVASFVDIVR